jgi:hypothetical protein
MMKGNSMKNKLTPVKALVLAAVIGGTYAKACWYEVSETCVESGNAVDQVNMEDETGGTQFADQVTIYASSTWNSWPATDEYNGAGSYGAEALHTCDGPASFTYPITGQHHDDGETISWWQYGAANPNGNYPQDAAQYTGVDYTTSDCE